MIIWQSYWPLYHLKSHLDYTLAFGLSPPLSEADLLIKLNITEVGFSPFHKHIDNDPTIDHWAYNVINHLSGFNNSNFFFLAAGQYNLKPIGV